ncbi:addiction module protein [Candidatus Aalborgicola defluviihabitans]|uniref:addiction module protein n=1 Tax=Candidatus Aalborgicola defluviihabitans TaxID=3386187 RepID=UPI0039B9BA0F
MNQISVADILELPVQERIQLVEVIWESIAAFPHAIEVSPELKTELKERLADFECNPEGRIFLGSSKGTFEKRFVAYRLKFPVGPFAKSAKRSIGMKKKAKGSALNLSWLLSFNLNALSRFRFCTRKLSREYAAHSCHGFRMACSTRSRMILFTFWP